MVTVAGPSTAGARSRHPALPDAPTIVGWVAFLLFAGAVAMVGKAIRDDAPAVSVPAQAPASVASSPAAWADPDPNPARDSLSAAPETMVAQTRGAAPAPGLPGLPFLPAPGFREIGVGAPHADGAWEYTVVDARRAARLGTGLIVDIPSGEFLVAGVRLRRLGDAGGPRGIGAGAGPAPQEFELRDASGTAYLPASLLASDRWARLGGYDGGAMPRGGSAINVGEAATYALAFDVPAGSDGFRLRLLRPKLDVALQLP